jgi:glycine dehydrogenase subunit 1
LLVARSVHPEYQEVLQTYAKNQGMPITEFDYDPETGAADLDDLERKLNDLTAAVIVQSPNFFGVVEDVNARRRNRPPARRAAGDGIHRGGFAGHPGAAREADIVAGELQSFAISPSYGGPVSRASSPRAKSSPARCPAGWSARPRIRTAIARFA